MEGEENLEPKELAGTPGGIRTPDLLLRSSKVDNSNES